MTHNTVTLLNIHAKIDINDKERFIIRKETTKKDKKQQKTHVHVTNSEDSTISCLSFPSSLKLYF
ncbi:hypothetical protein AAMO2058_000060500 [Amorphochlora amoebiformis]